MGKAVLIIALGMSILVSIMALKLNSNADQGLETTLDFYENTKARIIANSGVEVYLEKLRRDKTLMGNFYNNSLMGGKYDIYISGSDSLITIKSHATYEGKEHTSVVTACREKVTFPKAKASLYVSTANLGINLNGNIEIDGNDYNVDGTAGPEAALPGIGVDNISDSSYVINTLKPKISNAILGQGGDPSVRQIDDGVDWMSVTENIIFAADTTVTSGTYSSGVVMGTMLHPEITYANGDVHFSGSAQGSGIMVVNGNLEMSGNFVFKGMIIVYGKSTIVTKTVGNAAVYGSAIFVGENIDLQATGNAAFLYSSQALKNAMLNLKSSRFKILSWWE